ncbi:anthranilate synthase component I family protein [Niabella beijingensis]|uniref:anthranilate synthase component I family protein n=1 Tax=Niabella beijingensis TaxID=2872700 RepID=UPI001CC1B15A|nr:anthranilate synthase component I family protein [Niabella beijingensis]MBZ4190845.1 anthranilate synthase component I family protein [Niabella beijingensis]
MDNELTAGVDFPLYDTVLVKAKVLNWLKQFNTFCFLDSCSMPGQDIEFLAGAGIRNALQLTASDPLTVFDRFLKDGGRWLFGHWNYELPGGGSGQKEQDPGKRLFPEAFFFEPEWLIIARKDRLWIQGPRPEQLYAALMNTEVPDPERTQLQQPVRSEVSREEYLETIRRLQEHLHRGDCYEINYCIGFFAEAAAIDPFDVYRRLSRYSPNPFSGLYRLKDQWLICASPERFLKKEGPLLISQPIKGTLKRNAVTAGDLEAEQRQLFESKKDRAENVMIVDLVRNDLSRICEESSVKVDELFGIYSFPQVHQMISTISGKVNASVDMSGILAATFPMGSMTGAPKVRVQQLIDQYEKSARGIFSGAVGYIRPDGDFDFNVVIRSIMYNASSGYLSYKVGSGITIYSDPEQEWEECLLKAAAIRAVLEGKG